MFILIKIFFVHINDTFNYFNLHIMFYNNNYTLNNTVLYNLNLYFIRLLFDMS